jgi:YegS/Rv2252/BmrU family lipid kinase
MVILNPYANRWTAGKRQPEAEAALKTAGIDYRLIATERPRHGIELAHQAALDGYSPIIAAGGDGSIGEVVHGMTTAANETGVEVPLGLLPMGSANDLTDNLGLPRDLGLCAQVIAAGKTRRMDLCQVNGMYFDNNSAMGLEPFITLIQQKIHRIKGTLRYLVATLRGVMKNPGWTGRLEWDGGEYSGPLTLVTVGNCRRTGGQFFVTPHADPFDGKLTFVYGYMPTRLDILRLLPRTMKPGKGNYVEHPAIHECHCTWLNVRVDQPTPYHADGEIQSTAARELEYRIFPGKIPVLLPGASPV